MSFEHVRPLIVPAEYRVLGMPAAFDVLSAPDLLLSWVELFEPQAMVYVTPSRAAEWDRLRPGWRRDAIRALGHASGDRVWTHEKRADDGTLMWVAMMHGDGLGSSRLLLTDEIRRAFPAGYLVAFPDRSCGMAIARDQPGLDAVRAMVASMHARATTPMVPTLREPADVVPPAL